MGVTNGEARDISLGKKYNLETSLYASNIQRVGSKVALEYGLRFSQFRAFGPDTVYNYNDTVPGIRRTPRSYSIYKNGQIISQFPNCQPRFSITFQIYEVISVKPRYNLM